MGRPNVSYVTNRLKVSIGNCLNFVLITLDRCDSFSQTDGGNSITLQCFDAVGWAAGRASGL